MSKLRSCALCLSLLLLLAACSGPSIPVPPTPTADPSAGEVVSSSHQHGQGSDSTQRLVTRYGGPISVELATRPDTPVPQIPLSMTYTLRDPDSNAVTVDRLTLTHERFMHMFVVSEDLSFFSHIHPEDQGNGQYAVSETLPRDGRYVLFNTFVSDNGSTQIERDIVATGGAPRESAQARPLQDLGVPRQVDGLTVTMSGPEKVRRKIPTTFTITVQQDGKPVTDLEPYLGAACHVVIVSADTKQFSHTHGDVEGGAISGDTSNMQGMAMPPPPESFGPNLQFTHTFMQPGMYKIWVQFQREATVSTVEYSVQVGK